MPSASTAPVSIAASILVKTSARDPPTPSPSQSPRPVASPSSMYSSRAKQWRPPPSALPQQQPPKQRHASPRRTCSATYGSGAPLSSRGGTPAAAAFSAT